MIFKIFSGCLYCPVLSCPVRLCPSADTIFFTRISFGGKKESKGVQGLRDRAGCLLSKSQGKILSINKKSLTAFWYWLDGVVCGDFILPVDDGNYEVTRWDS